MAVPASAVIEPAALPGTTIIPAGTLDDTSWLKPRWRSIATTHSLGASSAAAECSASRRCTTRGDDAWAAHIPFSGITRAGPGLAPALIPCPQCAGQMRIGGDEVAGGTGIGSAGGSQPVKDCKIMLGF